MKVSRKITRIGTTGLFFLLAAQIGVSSSNSSKHEGGVKVAIKVKAKSLVLGPQVTLGDISSVQISDNPKRAAIEGIIIVKAPPPGESTDISLTDIKRKLKVAGYGRFIPMLKGPRTVRIITAHNEIDKAFLKEGLAASDGRATGPKIAGRDLACLFL